ncbi:MAG: TetR/AcrR family transcriptional regulator [Aestuariivita sp.]|nr:TetR/AcrR family transcriptional regulator [Aestuariivita sp.]MCY4203162.1 TetR/AcrR family transcriptional regulator [Aestuariivita sp.]MCY4287754.1 TetR/AcrR family transcriptional regulator [Aestuariivita sp.]MCY4345713.1 TetR/AcrR family transcriptional regulator [Aestuariivita sp.]
MATVTRKRNPEISQARILEAAEHEFAMHGYEGARIDQIVQRAGVSKNLIYHYFGSKDHLFLMVMECMYERLRAHHADLQIEGLPPIKGMELLIRHTFQHFLEYPSVISLLNSENLTGAQHVRNSDKLPHLYSTLSDLIGDLLSRGDAEGVFRKGVDPQELYITISALGYFYLSNRHTLGVIYQTNLSEPHRIKARADHIVEVVLGYLRPSEV